jgi:hypothetical protein
LFLFFYIKIEHYIWTICEQYFSSINLFIYVFISYNITIRQLFSGCYIPFLKTSQVNEGRKYFPQRAACWPSLSSRIRTKCPWRSIELKPAYGRVGLLINWAGSCTAKSEITGYEHRSMLLKAVFV